MGRTTRAAWPGETEHIDMGTRRHSALVIVGLFGLLAVTSCAPSTDLPDTPELRLEKAMEIVQLERRAGAYEKTLDRGASYALQAAAGPLTLQLERELSADERERAKTVMRRVLAEFLAVDAWENAIGQVYAAHFTPAEMQAAIEFFSSPVGAKIIELQGTIDQQTADAVEEIIGSRIQDFIGRIDEELAREFPELAGGGS